MADVDPQTMFRLHSEAYLSRLDFRPKNVDVLEIYHFDVSICVLCCLDTAKLTIWSEKGEAPTINHMSLGETELKAWLTTARIPCSRKRKPHV